MPLVPACTCTDPNVCPHRHQTYSAIYSHGPPSGRWAPDYSSQYSYPYFPPWVAPAAPSLNTHDFIPYQPPPAPSPSDQPAFRVALGETTSQSVNVGQSMSAGNKRKRTNTGSSNARNPRRATSTSNSNTLPNTSLSSTPTSNNQNIPPVPAVHGVGSTTSTAFSGPSLPHPAFQLQLGRSIIEKGKNSSGKPPEHLMCGTLCAVYTPISVQLHFQKRSPYPRSSLIHQISCILAAGCASKSLDT